MSTKWHPYTEPPKSGVYVTLRFDDDGELDAIGFFYKPHGCFYKSVTAMWQRASVHPTHWAEIKEDEASATGKDAQSLDSSE